MKLPIGRVTSGYGMRTHPTTKEKSMHYGIDYVIADNKVKSFGSGVVIKNGTDSVSGNYTWIFHTNGVMSFYAHLKEHLLGEGCMVNENVVIGIQGTTGRSTGVHLHFGLKSKDDWFNPIDFEKKSGTIWFSKGYNGREVEGIQRILNLMGGTLRIDGDFGDNTEKAVKEFQKANGLVEDGLVGKNTLGKFESLLFKPVYVKEDCSVVIAENVKLKSDIENYKINIKNTSAKLDGIKAKVTELGKLV